MKKQITGIMALGATLAIANAARANLITDGDFESGTTVEEPTFNPTNVFFTTFVGWDVGQSVSGSSGGTSAAPYTAVTAAATPLAGNYSAKFTPTSAAGLEDMYQTFTSSSSAFDVTLSAVAVKPSSGGRTVSLLLGGTPVDPGNGSVGTTPDPVINLKVVPDATSTTIGDVQLDLNGTSTTIFSPALTDSGFNFTATSNFDDGTLADQNVNTIEIVGTMSSSGESYTVILNGQSSVVETTGQDAPGGFLSAMSITDVTGGTANSAFIVDNVDVAGTPTPEPASLGILAVGMVGMLKRRRRIA